MTCAETSSKQKPTFWNTDQSVQRHCHCCHILHGKTGSDQQIKKKIPICRASFSKVTTFQLKDWKQETASPPFKANSLLLQSDNCETLNYWSLMILLNTHTCHTRKTPKFMDYSVPSVVNPDALIHRSLKNLYWKMCPIFLPLFSVE